MGLQLSAWKPIPKASRWYIAWMGDTLRVTMLMILVLCLTRPNQWLLVM